MIPGKSSRTPKPSQKTTAAFAAWQAPPTRTRPEPKPLRSSHMPKPTTWPGSMMRKPQGGRRR